MAERRPAGYPKLKNYKPSKFMLPTSHYDKAKADRAVKFIENLCHTIVMMAKVKMKQSPEGRILRGFCYGDDVYAKETKTTVQLSGLSKPNRWTVLSGASAEGQ